NRASRAPTTNENNPMPPGLDLFRPSAFLRRSDAQPEEKVAHAVSRRHRRGFVPALLCLRVPRISPRGESQAPNSGPGMPRSTAPRTVAPGLTTPPTCTPGLTAPPIWADSAVGIMMIAATAPIIENLPSIRVLLARRLG